MSPNLVLVFVSLLLGVVLRRSGRLPQNAAAAFNGFVIWVSLPALILLQIPRLVRETPLGWNLLIPVSMAWLLFALSFAVFTWLGKTWRWSQGTTGALVLTAGLGNTSFVGLPLLESILGPASTPVALLVDQPGTFLVLSTVGVFYASLFAPTGAHIITLGRVARNVAAFPPFIALVVAIIVAAIAGVVGQVDTPTYTAVLDRLGSTLVPVALVSVGYQLKLSRARLLQKWRPLAVGLVFKLAIAPFVFLALYSFVFGSFEFATRVTVLEAAMAPMITAGIVAEEFGFDADLSSLMIGVGIPVSIATVHLWNALLSLVGF